MIDQDDQAVADMLQADDPEAYTSDVLAAIWRALIRIEQHLDDLDLDLDE